MLQQLEWIGNNIYTSDSVITLLAFALLQISSTEEPDEQQVQTTHSSLRAIVLTWVA